jgi:type IV pilus assembly protein PilO
MGGFSFSKLRQRDIAIIVIIVTLLAGLAWYFYMYSPTLTNIAELESTRDRLQSDVRRGEAAQRNLPVLREEVAQQELERQAFLAQLPRESDVADLLEQVQDAAEVAGVILQRISQGSISESIADVRPLSFDLATTGDYAETMSFLMKLEELQRFTKIRQIGLSANQNELDDPPLDGSFALTVYVYTGADPGDSAQ